MKMRRGRIFALLLAVAFLIPLSGYHNMAVAQAATPAFSETKKELIGIGETYQITIKNTVAGSTFKWSTSNAKVAKVSSKGVVTTVGPGTATIKCKVTYSKNKSKTLSNKITVVVPATEVKINNSVEKNGAHTIQLGDTYDFNRDIFPKKSTDKTFWSIAGGDAGCISIDNSSSGIITAKKVGKVILKATAVKSITNENVKNSVVHDAIIIEVVGPLATVNTADITDSTEIKVVFDSPIDSSTVIGINNKLLDSIELTMRKNIKGVLASDPGALTAKLSTDRKTLIINTANTMSGEYGINFTSKIKTASGLAIEEYYKQLSYSDNVGPEIKEVSLDDTGMIVTILFSEAMEFTNLKISNASIINSTGTSVEATTLSIISNRLNYIASADKKSLSINLSKISSFDYGKTFSVVLSGVTDLAGNAPSTYTLTAYLYTDASQKPQPKPLYVTRTAYNMITAVFDRSIQYAGQAQINGGSLLSGMVDSTDSKKVNYILSEYEASYSGSQTVRIGYWTGYNTIVTDISNSQMHPFTINFTVDQTSPVLMGYEFDSATGMLTLTYNEDVVLTNNSGIFNSLLVTVTDEIRSGTNLTYTKVESGDKKIVKLLISNMSLSGTYSFTLDNGFVKDNFKNTSLTRSITISNVGSTSRELPGPYMISQSSTSLNHIYLEFAYMIDVPSATELSNYTISGVNILSATVTKNTKDNGATVLLTVADGTINATIERPVTIRGIKGYNGSYSAIENFTKMVELKENKRPTLVGSPVFDKVTKNTVKLTFSEEIKGTLEVKVTQINSSHNISIDMGASVFVSGNTAYITMNSMPLANSYLKIDILRNYIVDLNGNLCENLESPQGAVVSY